MSEEDTVSYTLFFPDGSDLKAELDAVERLIQPEVNKYIWHKDSFKLSVDSSTLKGKVNYGENADDEWFIISLLFAISRHFPKAVIQVSDFDGDPLLIEAAAVTPRWAQDPSTADGRAYIHRGQFHLVPVAEKPSQLTPFPASVSITETKGASKVVRAYPEITVASKAVHDCLNQRLASDWSGNLHFVHVTVPSAVAQMLHATPQIVSKIVHRLFDIDSSDVKRCSKLPKVMPEFKLIKTGVEMTRCLYAKLTSKTLLPGKNSPWQLPLDKTECKEQQLGFKLSLGLELLLSDGDLSGENEQNSFIQRLERLGYFKGNLPGSVDYNRLKEAAESSFGESKKPEGDFIFSLFELAIQKKDSESIWIEKRKRPQDSEEWLSHDQESFDKLLQQKFELSSVNQFLQRQSDLEGIEEKQMNSQKLDINLDELKDCFDKLLDLTGENSDDEESDLDGELLESCVKSGKEMQEAQEYLLKSLQESDFSAGPANTLLNSLSFKK